MGGRSTEEPQSTDAPPNRVEIASDSTHMDNNLLFRSKIQVVDIPGKGKGIIATEDIQEYELILIEKPMMKQSFRENESTQTFVPPGYTHAHDIPFSVWKAIYKAADICLYKPKFEALSDAEKEQFMDLHDCYAEEEGGEKTPAGIFNTNAVGIQPDDMLDEISRTQPDATQGAVYRINSRFNHSCRPNVCDKQTGDGDEHLTLYATRVIRKGEELYLSYIDVLAPKHERQKRLEMRYNFQCVCEACAMPDSTESDRNREAISMIRAFISRADRINGNQRGEMSAYLDRLLKLYQICELEHVFDALTKAPLVYAIVETSFFLGDRPRAEVAKYAEDFYRCFRLLYGDQQEFTKKAREYVRMCETDTKYKIKCTSARKKVPRCTLQPVDVDEEGKKVLPMGTDVVLFGLQRAELNGRCGTIVEYKKESGRYGVAGVPGVSGGLALKPANFAQKVFIVEDAAASAGNTGLKSHTVKQVCGCELNAESIYEYTLKDQDTAELSSLPVTSIEFPIGCDVRVHGLQSEKGRPLNGTYGTIKDFDRNTKRYVVHFGSKGIDALKILAKNMAF